MPDFVTHATFALDLIDKLDNQKFKDVLLKHQYHYYLGSQGPDVFYVYELFSFKKNPLYDGVGNVMHDTKVKEFFIESIKYLKNNYSEILHSYLCGFMCHNVLDRSVHPYVYHVTGEGDIKYRGNHVRLERAIDSWFIINRWNVSPPHRFKIYKHILNFRLNKNIFVPYYNHVFNKVFDIKDGGKVFINSAMNYKRYSKILYDPFGIKKKFARWVDKHFNKTGKLVLETLFYYKNIDDTIDYMNLNKKEWHHPVLNEMKSNESFLDLYNHGLNEAKKEIGTINLYLDNSIDETELKTKIRDLSYATGLNCTDNNDMRYFNVIF